MCAPEEFGAVGDGITDDAAALKRWADAVNAGIPGKISKTYATSCGIILHNSLQGEGPDAGFVALSNFSGPFLLYISGGSVGTPIQLAGSQIEKEWHLQLASNSTFKIGDIVLIKETNDNQYIDRAAVAKIIRIYPDNWIFLDQPITFPISVGTVSPCKMKSNIKISDFFCRGVNTHNGIMLTNLDRPQISGLRTNNFSGVGFWMENIFDGSLRDLFDEYSGRGGSGASFRIYHCGHIDVEGMVSVQSDGYAMVINASNSKFSRLYSDSAAGRGIEFWGANGCQIEDVRCTASGATGLSIVYGCYHNTFINVTATRNAHQNVWLNGIENHHQKFFGVSALYAGVEPDISVSDATAQFYGVDSRSTRAGVADTVFA